MSAEFFDSNVLVYLFDRSDEQKRSRAEELVHRGIASGDGCISFQVVQETLNVVTRKLDPPATGEQAARFLDQVLAPLWRGGPSLALYRRTLELGSRFRLSFYDSMIVAAALEAGCERLWSEDLQDGMRIDGLTITDPFAHPDPPPTPSKRRGSA